MKANLKNVIYDQQIIRSDFVIQRNIPKELISCNEILVISGIRRCGKSTLIRQIQSLLPEKDYYLNFDDERLIGFKVEDFQQLHEVFIELFGIQKTFYFDEIQNITGWERFVRRLYDNGNKVFVTGSNAGMLSRELGTHLTGRFCQFELYPFSFSEYLQFKNLTYEEKDFFTTEGKANFRKELFLYLKEGGFPQYLLNKNTDYLKSLYESILYRDVMVRNNLTNERELLELVYFMASNVSTLSSYNSLTKIIGVKNPTTVKNYLDCLRNSYMLFQTNKFDYALKKQIHNPKKTYLIDNALAQRLGFNFSDNTGRFLENLIYIELRRRSKEVFYHSDKFECDFLTRENNQIVEALQVCHLFENQATKQREINGICEAMEKFDLKEGTIITSDQEEEISLHDKRIHIITAWKWLLKK